MASGKETPAATFFVGEGSGGSQPAAAAEGVTEPVAVPDAPAAAVVQEGGDDVAAGEIAPAAEGFACEICGARYPTEKAMFGHLRSHRDRGWRGAFSPPTFTIEEFAEYQDLLVKPEEEQLREIEEEERAAQQALPPPPPPPPPAVERAGERVVLDVDLNADVAPVEEFIVPDLNLPAPDDEE